MRQKLLMMLTLLVCTTAAWAWDGSGTSADPYLIKFATDWNTLPPEPSTPPTNMPVAWWGAMEGPLSSSIM